MDAFTYGVVLKQPFIFGAQPPAVIPDAAVEAYQNKLNKLKIRDNSGKPLIVNGLHDEQTAQAIIRLEIISNSDVDSGIWGGQCEHAYNALSGNKPELQMGSNGEFVKYLQYLLGLSQLSGTYNTQTAHAVRQFQKNNNLAMDGITGPITWAALLK
jgi:peptidoglycan hydrolase-like protein with peptidoglycan-binding domain